MFEWGPESWVSTVSSDNQRNSSPPDVELRNEAIFLRVVQLLMEGLKLGIISTKRDLYYRDVQLFGKQQVVDAVSRQLPRVSSSTVLASC